MVSAHEAGNLLDSLLGTMVGGDRVLLVDSRMSKEGKLKICQ